MDIHGLEVGAAPLFINLNTKNVREAARNLAREVDKQLDARYGNQRSESIQAEQVRIMDLFSEEYKKTLKEDWAGRKPPLPVAPPPADKPKEKPKDKGKGKGKGKK